MSTKAQRRWAIVPAAIALLVVMVLLLHPSRQDRVVESRGVLPSPSMSGVQANLERERFPNEYPRRNVAEATTGSVAQGDVAMPSNLCGTVIGPDGQIIALAQVILSTHTKRSYPSRSPAPSSFTVRLGVVKTSVDGAFCFSVDPLRSYDLEVIAPAYGRRYTSDVRPRTDLIVQLTPEASLHGRVVSSATGLPVAGASVRAVRREESDISFEEREVVSTATDSQGFYAAAGLESGRAIVQVTPTDGAISEWARIELQAGRATRQDFVIAAGMYVRGQVVDSLTGEPVPHAQVGLGSQLQRAVLTDAGGGFSYSGLRMNQVHLLGIMAKGYAFESVVLGAELKHELELPLIRLVRGRSIDGRVVTNAGAPIKGALVAALGHYDAEATTPSRLDYSEALTGVDGTFQLNDLRQSVKHVLIVRNPGFGSVVYDLPAYEVERDGMLALGDVVLNAMVLVSGSVANPRGEPLRNRFVVLAGANYDRHARWGSGADENTAPERVLQDIYATRSTSRTDDRGQFVFADIAPGRYTIAVLEVGALNIAEEVLEVTGTLAIQEVALIIEDGLEIEGQVVDPEGLPIPSCVVECVGSGSSVTSKSVHVETDARGWFRFVGLNAGMYNVGVLPGNGRGHFFGSANDLLTVAAGTRGVIVRARAFATIDGVVMEFDGAVSRCAIVYVYLDGKQIGESFTDASGRFSVKVPVDAAVDLICRPYQRIERRFMIDEEESHCVSLPRVLAGASSIMLRLPLR